jgi:hypothetical protein
MARQFDPGDTQPRAASLLELVRKGQCVWAAAGLVLMTACGAVPDGSFHGGPAAMTSTASPSASPSPSLYRIPPPYQPASAGRVALPPALATGTCLVPFSVISEASGGFIAYPGSARQDDPSSVVALPGNTPGQIGVNPGLAYDRVLGHWVPVPLDWLAPGGQTYAYQANNGKIRAVTVLDGSSGDVTPDGSWELISTADDGVYAGQLNIPGAWFVPFGAAPTQVVDHGTWQSYANGALWGMDSARNLIQHDVTTAAETSWGAVSSVAYIVGFSTTGEPLVVTGGALLMLHLNGAPTTLWPGTGDLGEGGRAFADALGIWFEVDGSRIGEPGTGIYLWTPDKGAQLISSEVVHVMGPCG